MGLLGFIGKVLIEKGSGGFINDGPSESKYYRNSSNGSSVLGNIAASTKNLHDATDIAKRLGHTLSDLSVEEGKKEFKKGDHIATLRTAYSHHGIYDGNGFVYEYQDGRVQWNSLRDFSAGDKMYRVDESAKYSANTIIERAKSRLGEQNYNVAYNNCENFATWCRCGQ